MPPLPLAPTIALSGGTAIPAMGLGTWPMSDAEAAHSVKEALAMGYRLIDTAENYRNEAGVGEAMQASGLAREEIFLTTKFNREWHSVAGVRTACEASLKRLGTDYIDLYLIHWPNPDQDRYVQAFEGLVRVKEAGLVRAIGVSNFKPAHLERLFAAGFVPEVNQIQLDPEHGRQDLLALHRARGILTEGWSPLGRSNALLSSPVVATIAATHGRSAAQVVLRWQVQLGCVPLPRSMNAARQHANLDIFTFSLSEVEMAALNALDKPDPEMADSDLFGH